MVYCRVNKNSPLYLSWTSVTHTTSPQPVSLGPVLIACYLLELVNVSLIYLANSAWQTGCRWLMMHFICSVLLCSSVYSITEPQQKIESPLFSVLQSVSGVSMVNMGAPPLIPPFARMHWGKSKKAIVCTTSYRVYIQTEYFSELTRYVMQYMEIFYHALQLYACAESVPTRRGNRICPPKRWRSRLTFEGIFLNKSQIELPLSVSFHSSSTSLKAFKQHPNTETQFMRLENVNSIRSLSFNYIL
jgi:hypothetical protein